MQRYESYKPSGAEWLGDIPAHWTVTPAKRLFREVSEKNHPDAELLSVTQEFGVVPRDQLEQRVVMPTGQLQIFKLVREDDFVISLRSFQGGIEYSEFTGLVSPAYTILRKQKDANSRYLKHLLKSAPFISELNTSVTGIREGKNISFSEMAYSLLPLPASAEQARIADFLDIKTAEIDATIAKKELLIELIKEQKSTSIEKAITEGLEAPKNSMVGFTPKHWSRIKLKYCINLLPGFAFKSSSYSSNESDIPLLRGVNVNPGRLNWEDKVSWPKASLPPHLKYLLEPGDLVIGMDRPWVADGIRVAPVQACDLPCLLLQRVARLRAANRITQEFLALVLMSRGFLSYFEPMLTGISVPHISPEQIGNYEATLPPVQEQEAICRFVSQLSRSCEQAIAKETQIVNGLRQLRVSLVADVVLGKVKI